MADTQTTWNSAKTAFDQGRLQDALSQFLALVPGESRDAALSFNVGNLYYRLGAPGSSIAYLERALDLSPGSAEIKSALNLSRQALFSQTGTRDLDPAARFYERIDESVPLAAFSALFAILCGVSLAIRARRGARTAGGLVFVAFFGLAALTTASFAYLSSKSIQAVSAESSTVRSGPGESFLELSRIDAGIKLRGVDATQSPDWIQARFGSGKIGWVKKSTVLLLD